MVSTDAPPGAPGEETALEELRGYLSVVCPVLLGLEAKGERSTESLRIALATPDAAALLNT